MAVTPRPPLIYHHHLLDASPVLYLLQRCHHICVLLKDLRGYLQGPQFFQCTQTLPHILQVNSGEAALAVS